MLKEVGVIIIIGQQGSGKTLLSTKMATVEYKVHKRKVISNYKIKGIPNLEMSFYDIVQMLESQVMPTTIVDANGKPINLKDAYKKAFGITPKSVEEIFKDAVIVMDELHVAAHSYTFLSKKSRTLAEFASQVRKRGMLFIGVTQFMSQVTKQIRTQAKYQIEVSKVEIDKFENVNYFVCRVRSASSNAMQDRGYYDELKNVIMLDLSDYYDKYDTSQIIHYKPKDV